MLTLLGIACCLLADSKVALSGRVLDQQQRPIQNAIVVVSTARPRVGPSTLCPSCYDDCKKRVRTDAEGQFVIEGLSPSLLFSLAAGAPGYQGRVSEHFDPALAPEIELTLDQLSDAKDATRIRGKVIDKDGQPIVGAEVRTHEVQVANRISGSDPSVTPLTLTNAEGNFEAAVGEMVSRVALRVSAPACAPVEVNWERSSSKDLQVQLLRGASVRGQLVLQGKPLASIELGLVQMDRTIGHIVTPMKVSTDNSGNFQFDQLPPGLDYALYTHTGQTSSGVLPVSVVAAPGNGQLADLGPVPAQLPRTLSISVRTQDGSPIPEKSSVYVSRYSAWEGSRLPLPHEPTASVELNDVSREKYSISVLAPGYRVAETIPNVSPDLNRQYPVFVDGKASLTLILAPNAH